MYKKHRRAKEFWKSVKIKSMKKGRKVGFLKKIGEVTKKDGRPEPPKKLLKVKTPKTLHPGLRRLFQSFMK